MQSSSNFASWNCFPNVDSGVQIAWNSIALTSKMNELTCSKASEQGVGILVSDNGLDSVTGSSC